MKNKILVACAALAFVGCAENREFRNDSGASGGSYEMRSGSDTNNVPTTNNVPQAPQPNQNAPDQTSPQNNPTAPSSGDTLNRGNQL